ncbi:glycosyl hydrolase family7 [Chrysochromulina tobinii]|uniref:cellulose 1,4-beta-cellobiosidase (non-reducing end) n=1 Tax=Chrysochromulina tobinii TaxID=1460289 RepID=A0A0M0JHC2_9EUKA|nr:glycosyl hydrolase family7 [Chrysochromulina tobinii]|eukprot:KOO25747.1 glycosyl hydrolase family7 [Chrysochromulina sp. CCMP291]
MFYSSLVPSPEQAAKMQWSDVAYEKLAPLDKSLSFTIDMSAVPCGCNAALYLVQMDMPSGDDGSGYCDIQGFDDPSMKACTELDVIEGNQKALQSTLHTTPGKGEDGRCNQDGCAANWGRHEETNPAYGLPNTKGVPSHTIDSSKPLHVTATFTSKRINWYDDAGCAFEVEVAQGDRRVKLLDSTRDGNGVDRTPRPFASADLQRTYEAVTNGLVLVASLWTTDDLSWLDGGCDAEYPKSSSAGVEAAEVEAPEVEVEEAEAAEDEPEAPRVEKARADAEHRVKAEAESRARAALAAREAARQAAAVEAESRAKNARAREERARAKEEHERRLAEARALAKANKAAKEGSGVERHEEEQVLTFSASSRR